MTGWQALIDQLTFKPLEESLSAPIIATNNAWQTGPPSLAPTPPPSPSTPICCQLYQLQRAAAAAADTLARCLKDKDEPPNEDTSPPQTVQTVPTGPGSLNYIPTCG